jgi:hypothetical protein
MNLLVYRYGGIGDTLTLTAFLAAMRPVASRITLVGIAERLALIDGRLWDEVVAHDSVARSVDELAARHDLCIAFARSGFDSFSRRFDPFPSERMNIYRYMLACALACGGKDVAYQPAKPVGKGFLIHPGSGSAAKNAPLAWFLDEARAMKDPCFLLGPAESPEMEPKIRAAGYRVERPDTVGAMKHLIASRASYLGNDAGPAHLAAHLGLETRIRFISSDPAVWLPPGAVTV